MLLRHRTHIQQSSASRLLSPAPTGTCDTWLLLQPCKAPDPRSDKPQISSAVRVVSNRGNRYIRRHSGACKDICGFLRYGGKKVKHQRRENETTRSVPVVCGSLRSVLLLSYRVVFF
ncbi:hypothetical protein AVEN_7970-1 [Araneus ventricosus]|uniref:Uncharacterized protein n=1 Tax=Araneus ventricosus TaxID=182803 RepID=A0A4Y2X4H8_ARAVE|nr:hypothetical protein AVEN_7970-1 [Araneus ventricosus]